MEAKKPVNPERTFDPRESYHLVTDALKLGAMAQRERRLGLELNGLTKEQRQAYEGRAAQYETERREVIRQNTS